MDPNLETYRQHNTHRHSSLPCYRQIYLQSPPTYMTLQVSYTDFLRRAGSTAQREKRRYINSSNGQTQFEKPMILIRMAHRKGLQIPPKQHSLSSIINNTSRHYPRLRNKRNAKNLQVSHKTTILLRRPGTSCIIGKWRHVMKNSIINNNNYSSLSQSDRQTDPN